MSEAAKRSADRQISHLDPDKDDDDAPTQGETWKPASAEVLASRKYVQKEMVHPAVDQCDLRKWCA